MKFLKILPLVIFISLAYQNCGNKSKTQESSSPNSNSTSALIAESFQSNDPFNYNYMVNKKMIEVQLLEHDYDNWTQGKAIAINDLGLGFVSVKTSSTADAEKAALQACFIIGGNRPCALLASEDRFTSSSEDFEEPGFFWFNATDLQMTTLSAEQLPFVIPSGAQNTIDKYLVAASPKALTVSLGGGANIVKSTTNNPIADGDEAKRIALQRCEAKSAFAPCILVAVDDNIVFDPNEKLTTRINYTRTRLGGKISMINQHFYDDVIKPNYKDLLAKDSSYKGSIYINANGKIDYYFANHLTQAEVDTVTETSCQRKVTGNFDCFKYAEGLDVLPIYPNLNAYINFKDTLHCKAIPRTDCQVHANMGCFGDDLYVYDESGVPQLVSCPMAP